MPQKLETEPADERSETLNERRLRWDLHKLRVLVAEDDALIAMDHTAIIEYLGGSVVALAGSGEEAVELARRHRPDAVLMDVALAGEIDGIEAAERIRAECDVAIVFVTAESDPNLTRRMLAVSERLAIVKPVGVAQLREALTAACWPQA
jgi:CheY-like chemotaxis protein